MYTIIRKLRPFCLLLSSVFLISSCYKLQDYLHGQGDDDFKTCNIKKISSIDENYTITWDFTYNKAGSPTSVITNSVGTSNPNRYFFYDKYNRLVQLVSPYVNGYYEQWNKYGYNNKGQIAVDTSYNFGKLSGDIPLPSAYLTIIFFSYDAKGRIVHAKEDHYSGDVYIVTSERDYQYDASGNLLNGMVYDNKLNVGRTNAIWMFLNRNYSVNNAFIATAYNKYGLPVQCPRTDIVSTHSQNVKIEYFCD